MNDMTLDVFHRLVFTVEYQMKIINDILLKKEKERDELCFDIIVNRLLYKDLESLKQNYLSKTASYSEGVNG